MLELSAGATGMADMSAGETTGVSSGISGESGALDDPAGVLSGFFDGTGPPVVASQASITLRAMGPASAAPQAPDSSMATTAMRGASVGV